MSASGASFTFVREAGDDIVFVPGEHSGEIRAAAIALRDTLPRGAAIGLLLGTGPALIAAWFSAILAGCRPLILQYPTPKQSGLVWSRSVRSTIADLPLVAVITDGHAMALLGECGPCLLLAQADLGRLVPEPPGPILPERFDIIQMSSGTTGVRKAIAFSSEQLGRHIAGYNARLGLGTGDRIVSWLPLYHDMGYIACFVMPVLLGLKVIMMDPMDWVRRPSLLFDAIERHGGTTCYMPNFGFEVMSRQKGRSLPGMRRWISCSEPVSPTSSRRFMAAIGCDDDTFFTCYGMAENVFAITMAMGCRDRIIEGGPVVSCGAPIPGVDLAIRDGEIWVRSPTALACYLNGDDLRDTDGFYPTGDLGEIIAGELYVSGRRQDLVNQGGRKFMLSDVDLRLNECFPEIRGRAATLAMPDSRLGTETPLALVEAPDFFLRSDGQAMAATLREATALNGIEIAFVPPRFLTKTSSGKFNRRTSRADWLAVHAARTGGIETQREPRAELRESFAGADWTRPIDLSLDSLSRTILAIILESRPDLLATGLSLAEIDAALAAAGTNMDQVTVPDEATGIRIVFLGNRETLRRVEFRHLARLEQIVGCAVTLEHVCLPPSPVTFSDLIFHDYFQPRLNQAPFAAVNYAMEKLKGASLLITDDMSELFWTYESTYPVLSHNLERDPRADLISFRWQQYTRHHDQLPLSVVAGIDIPLAASSAVLGQMSRYLGTPIFRMAVSGVFPAFTQDWELHAPCDFTGLDPEMVVDELARWVAARPVLPRRVRLPAGARVAMTDLSHFCCVMTSKPSVDLLLGHFGSFCIAGQSASVPYLRHELRRLGKPYVEVPSHAPATLAQLSDPYDCLLLCGSFGDFDTDRPLAALQHAGSPHILRNLGDLAPQLGALTETPLSGADWYHSFDLDRMADYEVWKQARIAALGMM